MSRDPGKALLQQLLEHAGGHAELVGHSQRPWASITFQGSRHEVRLKFSGHGGVVDADAFRAALPSLEFAIPGHLVADATVGVAEYDGIKVQTDHTVEVLLLEDA